MRKFHFPGEPWQYVDHVDGTDVWYSHNADPNHAYVMGISEGREDVISLADVLTILPRIANTDLTPQAALLVRAWRDKWISDEWLFMDPYDQDRQIYSDVHKETYGFRPRTFPPKESIRESIHRLQDLGKV